MANKYALGRSAVRTARVSKSRATRPARWDGDTVGSVAAETFLTCNEVVPATNSQSAKGSSTDGKDKFADQNVFTPLVEFVKGILSGG